MSEDSIPKHVVLYADDNSDDIQLVKEAFLQYAQNIELVTLADGLEAVSYLTNLPHREPTPCLIILDINMPRMNGKEALVKLREIKRYKEVPIVLFTTSSQTRDQYFAEKYSAGFFTKPIDYKQMDLIVSKFIDHCTDEVKKNISKAFN